MDVEGFADDCRTNRHQVTVRNGVYHALQQAFHNSGIPWARCHHEDRGDSVFVLAPPEIPKAPFVETLPYELVYALQEHNGAHPAEERIRLRMALHAGEIICDDHGATGVAINLTFRLLEARPLKDALAASPGVLATVASSWFFEEVVRHSPGGFRSSYREIQVVVKETDVSAWIHLPEAPHLVRTPMPVLGRSLESVPHQLPAHTAHFVGREEELSQLSALLKPTARSSGAVVIAAISGTAGVGKTALAVHWAHHAATYFPDGQLYANLRGFDPTGEPMQPAEAIRGFLDAFQIPTDRIPATLDAQAAMYRSLLANRRMLVVLDNARDSDHIHLMLPSSPRCLVVVTSRDRLASLVARQGARPITLDVLNPGEAIALLRRFLGAERAAAEPDAVRELIARCAQLPLPLAIVAARAVTNPTFPLRGLADELTDEQDRLDALDSGDPDMSVRAVLSWSYRTLSRRAARLFRLLGLHPGPDIGLLAAASLTGERVPQTRTLLMELARAHLLEEHAPRRYRFHDLLRAYAAERAAEEEPVQRQQDSALRVLDHYLHMSVAAAAILEPCRDPGKIPAAQPGVTLGQITDYQDAMDWFTVEYTTLLTVAGHALRTGLDNHAWQLPWTLTTFLDRRGHWHDRAAIQQAALKAADQLGDAAARSRMHRNLGRTYARLRRHADAVIHYQLALALCQELNDRIGQAHTHYGFSWACERQGDHIEALHHAQHALNLYRTERNHIGEARALGSLGWYHALLGHYTNALTHCQQALDLHQELHDRDGKAAILHSLGYAHHHLGHHADAIAHYQQSLALWRELGDHYNEATTLNHLGDIHHALNDRAAAHRTWQQALVIFEDLSHPDREKVRDKLTRLSDERSPSGKRVSNDTFSGTRETPRQQSLARDAHRSN